MAETVKKFSELKVPELNDVAATFGVEFEPDSNKNSKLSQLAEHGVTVEMWNAIQETAEEEAEKAAKAKEDPNNQPVVTRPVPKVEVPEEEKVLIKMTRFNNTYHIRGYQFSRQHPFALVAPDDADYLCLVDGGFQMASPGEAREFYN